MTVQNVAVMRRRSDSWLNATQILKVAGVDKGKRTKVLEKEILTGEHEKVQGGYGKYQGTWIKYERGLEFCRQYGVEELLRPLLEYDVGGDGNSTAEGSVQTPTKEQAMAARRKRMYNAGIEGQRPNGQSTNGTFFKNISSSAPQLVAAISKARTDSPGARPASASRSGARGSQQMLQSQESFQGSQQSMASYASESSFGPDSAYATQNGFYGNRNGEMHEPPRKRMRPSPSREMSFRSEATELDVSMVDAPRQDSRQSVHNTLEVIGSSAEDGSFLSAPPLPEPLGDEALRKQSLLSSIFTWDDRQGDCTRHSAFMELTPEELDVPLDVSRHTALHWAATLAKLSLLKALVAKGANIFRVNSSGETALIRACLVTNNHEQSSFPDILELLGPTIEARDGQGRTVLHHIAVSSAVKGRSNASRYYLESLLEFVVRQGSAQNSQNGSFNGGLNVQPPKLRAIGLGRFMSEIVNVQDRGGDTALNIAARIGNKSIIQQLLEVGANPNIPNRAGLKATDFGVGNTDTEVQINGEVPLSTREARDEVSKVVGETSADIMSCKPYTTSPLHSSILY
jgi:regulatory protein SWI6